jgi:hypothetical protein
MFRPCWAIFRENSLDTLVACTQLSVNVPWGTFILLFHTYVFIISYVKHTYVHFYSIILYAQILFENAHFGNVWSWECEVFHVEK